MTTNYSAAAAHPATATAATGAKDVEEKTCVNLLYGANEHFLD